MKRIVKVKTGKGEKVTVAYQIPSGGDWDDYSMSCYAQASPGFYAALEDLVEHVLRLLELPASYGDRLTVTGVSLSWTDNIMGAVVTAQKYLTAADAPLVLNTPHLPSAPYGENAGGKIMPGDMVLALETIQREAVLYVEGKRAQLELFPDTGQASETPTTTEVPLHHVQGLGIDRSSEPQDDTVLEPAEA
ncbi:MAG: hypothetical protein NTU93_00110 [Arthrobacter sp.]|nr:hypothetical protein [Arthrobacter sp.]